MKNNITVGITLILASAICVVAFAITSVGSEFGAPFILFAWCVYLGLGLYIIPTNTKKDKPSSDEP